MFLTDKVLRYLFLFLMVLSISSCPDQLLVDEDFEYDLKNMNEDVDPITFNDGVDNDLVELESFPVVTGFTASRGEFADRVVLKWDRVAYHNTEILYHVYRSLDGSIFERRTGDEPINDNQYEENLHLNQIEKGLAYYYFIRVVIPSLVTEEDDPLPSGRPGPIVMGSLFSSVSRFTVTQREYTDRIRLSWDGVNGAIYYVLKRAEATADGSEPSYEALYQVVGNSIIGTEYSDFSVSQKGDLVPQKQYWYRLYAYGKNNVCSDSSVPMKGSMMMVGSPSAVEIVDVTDGFLTDGIRIVWKDCSANSYLISRITEADIAAGNLQGTEISLNADHLISEKIISIDGKDQKCVIYYDNDPELKNGEIRYYRIAGVNDIGIGRSTPFSNNAEREVVKGFALMEYENLNIEVSIKQNGFFTQWPECMGANAYLLFRSETAPSGDDSQWKFVSSIQGNSYLDPVSNMPVDFQMESGMLYYKVKPYISNLFELDSDGSLTEKIPSPEVFAGDTITSLRTEMTGMTQIAQLFGQEDFSAWDYDYTVPVPDFMGTTSATSDDESYKGFILVTSGINDLSGLNKLNIRLLRTCRYGDESGVYPLAEPRATIGGVTFSKKGQGHIESVESFDLKPFINMSSGSISFSDPMHDFRDGRLIADSDEDDGFRKHHWNYAAWDLEAWKDIKRQKPFNMGRAITVDYKVVIERSSDPQWGDKSSTCSGYPALTNLEFAQLGCWLRDVTYNRMSLLNIPRYSSDKTIAFLIAGNSMSRQGEYNKHAGTEGQIWVTATINGTTANIYSSMEGNYSDWPGFSCNSKKNDGSIFKIHAPLDITDTGEPRNITGWLTIDTPFYDGTIHWNTWVQDFIMHFGLDYNRDNPGFFKMWHKGRVAEVPAKQVTGVKYDKSGEPYGWEMWDTGGDIFPQNSDWYDLCYFTRINFKYRPVPCKTDFAKEEHPEMVYGYQY